MKLGTTLRSIWVSHNLKTNDLYQGHQGQMLNIVFYASTFGSSNGIILKPDKHIEAPKGMSQYEEC